MPDKTHLVTLLLWLWLKDSLRLILKTLTSHGIDLLLPDRAGSRKIHPALEYCILKHNKTVNNGILRTNKIFEVHSLLLYQSRLQTNQEAAWLNHSGVSLCWFGKLNSAVVASFWCRTGPLCLPQLFLCFHNDNHILLLDLKLKLPKLMLTLILEVWVDGESDSNASQEVGSSWLCNIFFCMFHRSFPAKESVL